MKIIGSKKYVENAMPVVDDLLFSDGKTARKTLENHTRNIYKNDQLLHCVSVACDEDLAPHVIGKDRVHVKSFITLPDTYIFYDEVNGVFELRHPIPNVLNKLEERFRDHVNHTATILQEYAHKKDINTSL